MNRYKKENMTELLLIIIALLLLILALPILWQIFKFCVIIFLILLLIGIVVH